MNDDVAWLLGDKKTSKPKTKGNRRQIKGKQYDVLGKTLFAIGVVILILAILGSGATNPCGEFTVIPTVPALPLGVGGTVKIDGDFVPAGTIVTVRNLHTGSYNSRPVASNGYYAIGIEGYDGDCIMAECMYDNEWARVYFHADTDVVTQWCNLTIGDVAEGGFIWSWLFIPAILLMGCGVLVVYWGKKKHETTK